MAEGRVSRGFVHVGELLKLGIATMHQGREAVLFFEDGELPMRICDRETGEVVRWFENAALSEIQNATQVSRQ